MRMEDFSSQPTYEELKPPAGPLIAPGCLRSQPTYEELKRISRSTARREILRSQPTYEELKPSILSGIHDKHDVPSLPMRN